MLRFARRRRLLEAALTLGAARLVPAAAGARLVPAAAAGPASAALPAIPALEAELAGRSPLPGRVTLVLPRLADNGNTVPMRVAVAGPFAIGAHVRSIALYSEKNPVPLMARFDFLAPLAKVEVESRVRLAGSQHVVALATLANGDLYSVSAEVEVTLAGCLDGT